MSIEGNTAMKIRTMGRHVREGFRNVARNGWMTFASTSAIAISLLILGVFLILTMNVNHLASVVENQVEVRVLLKLDTTPEQVEKVRTEIGNLSNVKKVDFVSKDEGLELMKDALGEEGKGLLEGLKGEANPLPDAFVIQVYKPREVGEVADKIGLLEHVDKVKYGQGTVEKLFWFTNLVRNVGLTFVIGLSFTAMFLIANTIKLTIVARRKEISIMKLVGATNSFIRWPFFVEGVILGLIGSVLPIGILLYGYSQLMSEVTGGYNLMMIELMALNEIAYPISLLLLSIGMLIGVWGSVISVRKFLKV
jgi:cell division transport system permease protein